MYCPQCAAPIDGSKFCRNCGTNVSLVSQAITGRLPEPRVDESSSLARGLRRLYGGVSLARGLRRLFVGISFLIVAIYLMRLGGEPWGVWLLIPGFGILARGIAEIIRVKQEQRATFSSASGAVAPPLPPHGDFLAPTTSKLAPPASITEETTRHFDHSADSVQR
jgi:hypothetical protein